MTESQSTEPRAPPTTAELRDRMPSRRTPDKSSARDPAAAPFDTDAEAAATPAQPEAVDRTMDRYDEAHPTAGGRRASGVALIGVAVIVIALIAVLGWLVFFS